QYTKESYFPLKEENEKADLGFDFCIGVNGIVHKSGADPVVCEADLMILEAYVMKIQDDYSNLREVCRQSITSNSHMVI
ncbi:MAG TPA: hypothetical protein VHD33_04025, partial [Legionellaceae bacterium]|nr:hypothetical protein [Legionellaceae bacterium]